MLKRKKGHFVPLSQTLASHNLHASAQQATRQDRTVAKMQNQPMTHGRKKSIRASTGVQTSAEVDQ